MYNVKVVDHPETMSRYVYVYMRNHDRSYSLLVPFEGGYIHKYFEEGQALPDNQEPTFSIAYEWEQQLVEALSPAVPKVEQFVYDTVSYERTIIDRLLK